MVLFFIKTSNQREGEVMKRIAIISLIVMFLTGQYAFSSCPYENLAQTGSEAQELTQEQAEEVLIELDEAINDGDMETLINSLMVSPSGSGICFIIGVILFDYGQYLLRNYPSYIYVTAMGYITLGILFIIVGC
jgi:hypothetical protein